MVSIAAGSLFSDIAAWAPARTFRSISMRVVAIIPVSTMAREQAEEQERCDNRELDGRDAAGLDS